MNIFVIMDDTGWMIVSIHYNMHFFSLVVVLVHVGNKLLKL